MSKRMVDRNSMRAGAGISAVVLLVAFVLQWHLAVVAMAIALGMGSLLGLRYSPLGATYRLVKKTLRLGVPVEPEEEPPPRFAQTLGFAVLAVASIVFVLTDATNGVAWGLTLIVAFLQGLLAATGLCVGCEIYLYTRRFAPKGA